MLTASIVNLDTQATVTLQYPPSEIERSGGAPSYQETGTPQRDGQPLIYTGNSNEELRLSRLIWDKYLQKESVNADLGNLRSMAHPSEPGVSPPLVSFVLGSKTFGPAVISDFSWTEQRWVESGEPSRAFVSLTLRRVPETTIVDIPGADYLPLPSAILDQVPAGIGGGDDDDDEDGDGGDGGGSEESNGISFTFEFPDNITDNAKKACTEAGLYWGTVIKDKQQISVKVDYQEYTEGFLASAMWTELDDQSPGMPKAGNVRINKQFEDKYNSDFEYAKAVVIHELAHILGIGSLWKQEGRSLLQGNQYKTGTEASKYYNNEAIPVEPNVNGHWDEDEFGVELMTPSANGATAAQMYISKMTLASFLDIGWKDVNVEAGRDVGSSNFYDLLPETTVQKILNGQLPPITCGVGYRSPNILAA